MESPWLDAAAYIDWCLCTCYALAFPEETVTRCWLMRFWLRFSSQHTMRRRQQIQSANIAPITQERADLQQELDGAVRRRHAAVLDGPPAPHAPRPQLLPPLLRDLHVAKQCNTRLQSTVGPNQVYIRSRLLRICYVHAALQLAVEFKGETGSNAMICIMRNSQAAGARTTGNRVARCGCRRGCGRRAGRHP